MTWPRTQESDWLVEWSVLCRISTRTGTAALSPERTYPDMFDAHPPFQIDGNFGGASAIAEMLLQSQTGEIEFLPALPKAWPNGSVKGLRARGDFQVDLTWQDGKMTYATVHSFGGNPCHLRYGNVTREVKIRKGETIRLDGNLH